MTGPTKSAGRRLRGRPGTCAGVGSALMLALACALLFSPVRSAAAPFSDTFEFTQPDGAQLTLWGAGDDFHAVFETSTGYTVIFDPPRRMYFYADLAPDGMSLVSSGVPAQDPAPPALARHLRADPAAVAAAAKVRQQQWDAVTGVSRRWSELKSQTLGTPLATAADGAQPAPPGTTTLGAKVGLTLLIDFADAPAASGIGQAEIDAFLNGDSYTGFGNNGSVKKYFSDVSAGRLTYTNVVTIYIRMTQPKSFYNNTSIDCGIQGRLLINDALAILKARSDYTSTILPTFGELTTDGSGRVAAFNVFFAGGSSGAWSFGLWPHSWGLATPVLLGNGKSVSRYQITNIGTSLALGTFCHENGHMLCGFPDIYDYGYDSTGGAGKFCLMNSGGHGTNPSQVCAYLKLAAGWATAVDLNSSSVLTGTLVAAPGSGYDQFYRYRLPGATTEYFLFENRQKAGRDAGLPAAGIAAWHIDELGSRDNQSLAPNTLHDNYEVTLEQADNLWHFQRDVNAGDAFDLYYQGNGAAAYSNRLDDTSTPNARWWSGSPSGMRLDGFSAAAATMTFRIGLSAALPTVTVTANDALATEAGTTTGQFTVTRTGATTAAQAVNFIVGGTATPGSDYTGIAAGVTIPAGAASVGLTVTPIDDTVPERDETVSVELNASTAYGVGSPASATVTIQDDDAPSLAAALDTALTVSSGGDASWWGQTAKTHDGVDAAEGGPVGDGQVSWMDATATGSSVSFWWGVSSEADWDFLLFFIDGVEQAAISGEVAWELKSFALAAGSHTLRWEYSKDADCCADGLDRGWVDQLVVSTTPLVTVTANDAIATEAGPTTGQFTVTRAGTTTAALTVDFVVTGTATAGSDFTSIGSSVTIPAGVASATIIVTPIDDPLVESDETVIVTLSPGAAYTVGSPAGATVTITSDDGSPATIQLSSAAYAVGESAASVTITATRGGGGSGGCGVSYATADGTALAGSDYTAVSGTLIWADGDSATKSFTVPITSDIRDEANETFTVTLAAPTGVATLGTPGSGTVTITDDDLAPIVQFYLAATSGLETSTSARVIVYLTASSGRDVMVNYATANGTALAGSDYTAKSGTLTIAAGQHVQMITVPIANDTSVEPDETFTITLTSPVNATLGAVATHTYSIYDDGVPGLAGLKAVAEAVDQPAWAFTTSAAANWWLQGAVSHDGTDAARSGFIGNGTASFFQTTGSFGAGTVSFWWKVSSEQDFDFLRFSIDGAVQVAISGEVGWQQQSFPVSAGTHTLKWEYYKDASYFEGIDAAWVDQIVLPAALVLWTRGDSGEASLWAANPVTVSGATILKHFSPKVPIEILNQQASPSTSLPGLAGEAPALGRASAGPPPDLIAVTGRTSLAAPFGEGGPWEATSCAHADAATDYVLWSRADTGQAVLEKIEAGGLPGGSPVTSWAYLNTPAGEGGPWQATSYTPVDATTGYVLWTRGDTGQAMVWKVAPGEVTGTIPVISWAHLDPPTGVGGPWQATSYTHVDASTGYVLWTRSDTGEAILWKVAPGEFSGTIPVTSWAYLDGPAGVGGPWEATSYTHIDAAEGYVLWTRGDTGQAILWQVAPGEVTGTIPVTSWTYVSAPDGVGSPWRATSYVHGATPGGPR